MKIKNLTIGKIKEICKSKRACPKTCPLKDHQWCCLGLRNMTTIELESEIVITKPERKYYVKFTKYDTYDGEKRYQSNCGFCVKDLHSYSIKRPFGNFAELSGILEKHPPPRHCCADEGGRL